MIMMVEIEVPYQTTNSIQDFSLFNFKDNNKNFKCSCLLFLIMKLTIIMIKVYFYKFNIKFKS